MRIIKGKLLEIQNTANGLEAYVIVEFDSAKEYFSGQSIVLKDIRNIDIPYNKIYFNNSVFTY